MLCLAESSGAGGGGGGASGSGSRRIVIAGIPGVGKTTLVTRVVEVLRGRGRTVRVVSFGTAMLEEARKRGIADRDMLRKLPLAEQRGLQTTAASAIASMSEEFVIVDTHAFIKTPSGYYPGLPSHVIEALSPSNLISVHARPEDIYNRRVSDGTRNRDHVSIDDIKNELAFHQSMISACSVISGSPVQAVLNSHGEVDAAAETVIRAVGL